MRTFGRFECSTLRFYSQEREKVLRHLCCVWLVIASIALLAAEPATAQLKDFDQFKQACGAVGKPIVLVNVWAVTCSHCMDELTLLSKFSRGQFKDSKELGFMSVCLADLSLRDFRARYAAVLSKKNIPYTSFVWSGELSSLQKELQLEATPYTALFSSAGRLLEVLEFPRGEQQSEEAIRNAVKKVLAAPAK